MQTRTSAPDVYTPLIRLLRQRREAGQLSRQSFGYLLWFFWQRRHGRWE